jgi:hypothetical protein
MANFPFEVTREIKRYLDDILYLHDEWGSTLTKNTFYLIKEETGDERSTPKQWGNNARFWDYLKEQKALIAYPNLLIEDIEKVIGKTPKVEVIAIARTHEENEAGKHPIAKFIATPENWQEVLEKISTYTTEHHNQDWQIVKPYLALQVLNITPVRNLLNKVDGQSEESMLAGEQKKSLGLPDNVKWQDITIRFIDNGDNVEISTKEITKMASYQDMGFEDSRKKRPNVQWHFLRLLAMPQFNGELSWEKISASGITNPKEQTNYKKKKQLLAKTLKNYFGIREDPFHSYRKNGLYRIKIKLMSSPDQEVKQYDDGENDDLGVNEYLKEHMTNEYEGENNL